MNNFTLGRYVSRDTFLHKMDPRNKLVSLILLMVAVFIQFNTINPDGITVTDWVMTGIVSGILFVFILFLVIVSKVGIKSLLKSLKTLWFIVLFLFIINIFVPPAGAYIELVKIGKTTLYLEGILQSLKIFLRLFFMLSLTFVLTATTKPMDLTYALEFFMNPLKVIKFPAHEIAMTISIALRFIPTLLEETEKIMKAQESRGVDFKHGKISTKFKAIISLIVPLFVSSFERSEQLADAMEARGYDPKAKRTKYRNLKWSVSDFFSLLMPMIVLAAFITASVLKLNLSTPYFYIYLSSFVGFILIYTLILGLASKRRVK